MARSIVQVVGRQAPGVPLSSAAGDVRHPPADMGRTRRIPGHGPAVCGEEGLHRTVTPCQEQPA